MGITLSSFSAVSVDENWVPAFIEGSSKTVHKVSPLVGLSLPSNARTVGEAGIFSGLLRHRRAEHVWAVLRDRCRAILLNGLVLPFAHHYMVHDWIAQIAREGAPQDHQFILKPVSGEGRVRTILQWRFVPV